MSGVAMLWAGAHDGDGLAGSDGLASMHQIACIVTIGAQDLMGMLNQNHIPIARQPIARISNPSTCRGTNGLIS